MNWMWIAGVCTKYEPGRLHRLETYGPISNRNGRRAVISVSGDSLFEAQERYEQAVRAWRANTEGSWDEQRA